MSCSLGYTLLLMLGRNPRRVMHGIRTEWRRAVLTGVCAAVWVYLYFAGLDLLDPTIGTLVFNGRVVWGLLLGALLLGERYGPLQLVGIGISVVGIGILGLGARDGGTARGVVLMAVAGLFYVLTTLNAKHVVARAGVIPALIARYLGPLLFLLPFALAEHGGGWSLSGGEVLLLLGASFAGPFLSFLLIYAALRYLHLGVQILYQSSGVFLTAVWSLIVHGEILQGHEIVSGVVVIAGLALMGVAATRKARSRREAG
jgi:drug/metabolite transporter (DMT)-like permease